MISASLPPNETERLHSLRALDILDTSSDPTLDALVRTAARMLECPIALVSLVDAERQWFKASVGMSARETPRDMAFCAHAILGREPLVVPDTTDDPRFADNPLVTGAPHVAFYAGVPLFIDTHALGTLCVIDHRPRELSDTQYATLVDLAKAVEHWLESRRAQLRLADSERQFRLMAEQTPAIVYRAALDTESSTLYVSPRVHELGYTPEEWVARPGAWLDAIHPEDRQRVVADLASSLQAGDTVQMHYRLRDAQGRWRHYEDIAQRTRPPGSDLSILQGVMIDVTDKVQARLADPAAAADRTRQESQLRRLSAAVQQASEAILVTDLLGRIVYVNQSACDSSGYTEAELIGQHTRLLKSGNTPAQTYAELWSALGTGNKWRGFLFNRRRDGSEYVEFATITPVRDSSGAISSYLAVKEDVTEKRRMHDELEHYRLHLDELVAERTAELERARAAAEAASTAKSAFLAAMSHEIRTPMNGVIGMTEVLRQSDLTPDQQDLASTISESAAALLRVLDDILDFSKIEAGRLQLETRPFELGKVVEGSCDTFQAMASTRGVVLRCFVDPAMNPERLGDAFRLRQIITNLVGNAIKFSSGLDRAGLVQVRALAGEGDAVVLEVHDNGIGMTDAVRSGLFQPFVQGESSTTRKYGGTGLGLVICQRLAQAMGGTIVCESQPDAGSLFRVTLPIAAAAINHGTTASTDAGRLVLQGLCCHLLLGKAAPLADWSAYLVAAGATVRNWHQWPDDTGLLTDPRQGEPVLLVDADRLDFRPPAGIKTVLFQAGQRRMPSRRGDGMVVLDTQGLHRTALVDAVRMATHRPPAAAAAATGAGTVAPASRPPHDTLQAAAQGRLVLVAEDNEVNRQVIGHQLRLIGMACELVENGALALQRLRATPERYALVLTDLHMPELDGFQLVEAIRKAEPGQWRMPVVALTANAMHGEAARCTAAGMDAYLSKPVSLDLLKTTLAQCLRRPDVPSPVGRHSDPAPVDAGAPAQPVFDETALARLIGNHPTMLADLRARYLANAQQAVAEVAQALSKGDLQAASRVGHRLKSSSRYVGAIQLAELFDMLEHSGRAGDGAAAQAVSSQLPAALEVARAHLVPEGKSGGA